MISIEVDNKKTGWIEIPASTEIIVAHFYDGHRENMDIFRYVTMDKKKKELVKQIDCYSTHDQIPTYSKTEDESIENRMD